jgi:hypothetical protein
MDPVRLDLIAIVSSLSRLLIRLHHLSCSPRKLDNGKITCAADARWGIGDLSPPSPWFDAANPRTAISGGISAVLLVQAHLLAMIEAPGEIDVKFAIRVVEHLCRGPGWSARVRALADRLGYELPSRPWDLHHGLGLEQIRLPRRGERHTDP